jgi:hypothetical protein
MLGTKPLGRKNYGSIPHLPGSRIGPGDHHVHEGQYEICCVEPRDKNDAIFVTEKLDGSNVGVARIGDDILALGRAGWLAQSSPYEQHQLFAAWVRENDSRFRSVLKDGERIIGEWLAQAHGTRYDLDGMEPFVAFDLMKGEKRFPQFDLHTRCAMFSMPRLISWGKPCSIEEAMCILGTHGFHGAIDPVEGAVWRVERNGQFDFMAKYVRPDKIDGAFLPEVSGKEAVWNWRPYAAKT